MLKFNQFIALVLSCVLIGCGQKTNYDYLDINDKPVSIQSSKQWTLVAYWADWCTSCRSEVQLLNNLNHKDNLQVVGCYFRDLPKAQLRAIVENIGIEFPVITRDPKDNFHWDEIAGLPTHYVISPDNQVYGPYRGPMDEEALLALIQTA